MMNFLSLFFKYFTCTWFTIFFLYGNQSIAQTENVAQNEVNSPEDATKLKKKHSLNFEDELVEGSAQKPDLFYIFEKKNFNYKRLIRLRENFIPEMRRTSEDIKRLRGGR